MHHSRYRPFVWLAVAAVLLFFSQGRWVVPLATWLAPVFLIRFLRTRPLRSGWWPALLVHGAAFYAWYAGVIPGFGEWLSTPSGKLLVIEAFSLAAFLPYLADRLLAPRLPGPLGTFVFPLAWVALQFANASLDPMGGWGSLAVTQTGNLPLLQLISVTGMYGIDFLITWGAAVTNEAWTTLDARGDRRGGWTGAGLFAAALALVLLGGGLRLALFPPESQWTRSPDALHRQAGAGPALLPARNGTVRVAGLSGPDVRYEVDPYGPDAAHGLDALLAATVREARAGARILVWAEAVAFPTDGAEAAALMARAQAVAHQEEIYLLITPYIARPDQVTGIENKSLLIGPDGQVAWEYWKNNANLLEGTVRGDGKVALADTPYGRLAGIICWDGDFPAYVRQAGQAGADILLAPAADWRQIDPTHTQMSVLRAVENGVSLVRPTRGGLSAAYDYQGRPLAVMDHFLTTEERTLVANVPVRGVRTVYARVGDVFAWLCVTGLAALAVRGTIRRPVH